MTGRLADKVAVITGAASGIGRGCAERFAEEGAHLVLADILPERGKETLAAVHAVGAEAIFVETDVSKEEDTDRLADAAVEQFGRIDVLVACAGISHAGYVSGENVMDPELLTTEKGLLVNRPTADWHEMLAINLTGAMYTDRAVARKMLEHGTPGSIINISSDAAYIPVPRAIDYGVAKAGVWSLTKSLAAELAPHGIRVNSIAPGFIQTPMTKFFWMDEELVERWVRTIPLGHVGQPVDIANAALFLASDESSFHTGTALHPNGGVFTA